MKKLVKTFFFISHAFLRLASRFARFYVHVNNLSAAQTVGTYVIKIRTEEFKKKLVPTKIELYTESQLWIRIMRNHVRTSLGYQLVWGKESWWIKMEENKSRGTVP